MVCGGGDMGSESISPDGGGCPFPRLPLDAPAPHAQPVDLPCHICVLHQRRRGLSPPGTVSSVPEAVAMRFFVMSALSLPPTNGFDGETNPSRAAQESCADKRKPRVMDFVGVGWPLYYFSKLL
jgi:hypothetical protein